MFVYILIGSHIVPLMYFVFQNKDEDLLDVYQYGCDPFCMSLLTDRHLKVRRNSDFV